MTNTKQSCYCPDNVRIFNTQLQQKAIIIGIAGASGSGKSLLASIIAIDIIKSCLIHILKENHVG